MSAETILVCILIGIFSFAAGYLFGSLRKTEYIRDEAIRKDNEDALLERIRAIVEKKS